MINAKQADFNRWAAELDYRCAHCENDRILTTKEKIVQRNIYSYEQQFKDKKLCSNPDCRYPLDDGDRGFYVAGYGPCCWLCHDMDNALRQTKRGTFFSTIFEWFDAAHKRWVADGEQAKKVQRGEDQTGWGGGKL